jgi:hypothetical protein
MSTQGDYDRSLVDSRRKGKGKARAAIGHDDPDAWQDDESDIDDADIPSTTVKGPLTWPGLTHFRERNEELLTFQQSNGVPPDFLNAPLAMFDSALKQVQNVRKVHVKRSADSDAQADDGRRKKAPYPIKSSAGSTASTRPSNWGQYQFMTTTGVIHPTRSSSLSTGADASRLSTGADASRSQYPGGGADDFMDETPYLAPEDEDLGMQAESATPSRLSAIAEVPTPVAIPGPAGHAVFGQSLSGTSFGFQSGTDMWQGPPRYPQGVSA